MADKTPQQLAAEERERIKVTGGTPEKTAEEIEAEKKTSEEAEAKSKEEKEAKEKEEADKAKKTDEKEPEEIEVEEGEKDPEKLAKTIERLQKRIDKLTAKNKLTETEKNELTAKLTQVEEAKGEKTLTEEDVKKEARKLADQDIAQRDFINACNRIFDNAVKLDKNFKVKVDAMAEEIGPVPGAMVGILDDLDNNGAILNHLVNNVDEAENYYAMSPAKMAVELTKLSTKLEGEKKPKPKEISKVPEHKEPPSGSQKTDTVLRDNEPMEDWVAKRNAQVKERQERKRAGMR